MARNAADAPDFTKYAEKPASALQEEFTEWLIDEVYGGESPHTSKAAAAAFEDGVRLATALRMPFQRSEKHQARLEESRGMTVKAAAPKKASKRAAEPDDEDADETPRKSAAKKAIKAARRPAAKEEAPSRPARRPARKRAAAAGDEAPF